MTTAAPGAAMGLPLEIVVVIPGEPCAQGRPRFSRFARGKELAHPVAHEPKLSRSWKGEARHAMRSILTPNDRGTFDIPFGEGPLTVEVLAVFTCPKSDWRKTKPTPRRRHAKKPDGENVAKAVLDAATEILWRDDSQVSDLVVRKRIGAQGEAPYVEIRVRALEWEP